MSLDLESEFWSRPTQNNLSSTKAEKWAILHGLEQCDSDVILDIYTDSQSTIDAIRKMFSNPSEREIIKIDDYPIVEKIYHELKRFHTQPRIHWVEAHADDPFNNAVDLIAKSAAQNMELPITDVSQYKTGINKRRDFHIHIEDNEDRSKSRMDRYPRKCMKKKRQQYLIEKNTERLASRWPDLGPIFKPDYHMTTAAVCSTLERENHLDCSNQRAHTYRINSIGRNLQFLDILNTYPNWKRVGDCCVFCNEPETQDHIWDCQHIQDNFHEYVEKTKEYAIKEMISNCKKRKVEEAQKMQSM